MRMKIIAVVMLAFCMFASWGLFIAVLSVDSSVDALHGEVIALRTGVADKTKEASDLQQVALADLRRDYKKHIQDIKDQVEKQLGNVKRRNDEMLREMGNRLAKLDKTIEACEKQIP